MKNYLAQVIERFKGLKLAQQVALAAAVPVLIFVFIGIDLAGATNPPVEAPVPTSPTATSQSAEPAYDPYAYYLAHNPDPKLVLSPQDAATRALMGCGYTDEMVNSFPVDKALREAYGPTGICG